MPEFKLVPLSIGLETLGGIASPVIFRGTPIPAKRVEEFSTAADNQTSVELSLYVGECLFVKNNRRLGKFHLQNIPEQKRGVPKVKVEFSINKHAELVLSATVLGSIAKAENRFDLSDAFEQDYVAEALEQAKQLQAEEEVEKKKIEAISRAKAVLSEAEERLSASANAELSRKVAELGLLLDSGSIEDIQVRTEDIQRHLYSPFSTNFNFGDLFGYVPTGRPSSKRTERSPRPAVKVPPTQSQEGINQELSNTTSRMPLGRIFGGSSFPIDPRLCFVLMPFREKYQAVYDDHIKTIVEKAGLKCERADEIKGSNIITRDIWERINTSRFLIADLTEQNANVFYELGLAHALGKDVILVTQSMEFVPFDLKALRCLVYSFTPRGMIEFEERLSATIQGVMKTN